MKRLSLFQTFKFNSIFTFFPGCSRHEAQDGSCRREANSDPLQRRLQRRAQGQGT
jgi:hypothetical protein